MAMRAAEVLDWLQSLDPAQEIAIDDGGLMLRTLDGAAYIEVGGVPVNET